MAKDFQNPYSRDTPTKAMYAEIKRRAVQQQREEAQAAQQAAQAEVAAARQAAQAEQALIRETLQQKQDAVRQAAQAEQRAAQQAKIRQDAQLRQEKQQAQDRAKRQQQQEQEEKKRVDAAKARFQDMVKRSDGSGGAGHAISNVINSSRVSLQDGRIAWQTLVQSFEGVLGEFAGPVAVAATAVNALEEASRHASAEMKAFRAAQFISGGTTKEVSEGEVFGRFLGMDKQDVARQARAFSERITSDPYAQATASQMGVTDIPGLSNGKIDKMKGLLDFIDKLRHLSDEEAIRAARATGTEDFLPLRDLDEPRYRRLRQYAQERAGVYGSPRQAAANAADDAINDQGKADGYTNIGKWWRRVTGQGASLMPGSEHGAEMQRDNETYFRRQQQTQERHMSSLDNNTAALNGVQQLLRQGIYGGGERAQGAIPMAFMGAGFANKQLRAHAHAMGAFGV